MYIYNIHTQHLFIWKAFLIHMYRNERIVNGRSEEELKWRKTAFVFFLYFDPIVCSKGLIKGNPDIWYFRNLSLLHAASKDDDVPWPLYLWRCMCIYAVCIIRYTIIANAFKHVISNELYTLVSYAYTL